MTSTSLMVDMPYAEEAARLSRESPQMSVGMHVALTSEDFTPLVDFDSPEQCRAELKRQWDRFLDLMACPPTHLDSHHNIHRDPRLAPHFVEWAARHELPLRENSPVKYFSSFYGQWDGETHLEQISVASICEMFQMEVGEGVTELSCHPGYADPDFVSGYSMERETELQTLCDPLVRQAIDQLGIELMSYEQLDTVLHQPDFRQG